MSIKAEAIETLIICLRDGKDPDLALQFAHNLTEDEIKPFYTGHNSRGYWEGWLVHDPTFGTIKCMMILEIEAE